MHIEKLFGQNTFALIFRRYNYEPKSEQEHSVYRYNLQASLSGR